MRGEITIDFTAGEVRLNIVLERMEDPGAAKEAIRNASRACWPTIMFNDETLDESDQTHESFETPASATSPVNSDTPIAKTPRDYSKPPQPGSVGAFVLDACRRLGTTDYLVIAENLDLKTTVASALIANFKRGGHLESETNQQPGSPVVQAEPGAASHTPQIPRRAA